MFTANKIPFTDDSQPACTFAFKTSKSKSMTPNYFTTLNNLTALVKVIHDYGLEPSAIEKYFIPFSCNYEVVDGFLFSDQQTLVLFQITVGKQHDVKPYGIKTLVKVLTRKIKKVNIIFIVPENHKSQYSRPQNILDSSVISPKGADLDIKQFCLVFCDQDMQSVIVQGPSEIQEKDDEDEDNGW